MGGSARSVVEFDKPIYRLASYFTIGILLYDFTNSSLSRGLETPCVFTARDTFIMCVLSRLFGLYNIKVNPFGEFHN